MKGSPFHRPELEPENPADLYSVYKYLKERVNYHVRNGVEYPTITPSSKQANLFFRLNMLSTATENYTLENWTVLERQISRLVQKRADENRALECKIAQRTTELMNEEAKIQPEDTETMEECVVLGRQINACYKTVKDIKREIDHQVELHSKLLGDPKIQMIRKKQELIEKTEVALEDFTFCNDRSLRRGGQLIERKLNEIALLEGELEAIESRLDFLYASQPMQPEWGSMQSDMTYDTFSNYT